ncbi:MAG: NAD(P)-dependent oxidoreductase [Spirochaetaceae bacterium]|nr:NAD(P)-dependent oxidoreductase [Spirochaetaceae bacterium]
MNINGVNVGFIGLGVMGKSMAHNLIQQGCTLFVFTRRKESAETVLSEGAIWCNSPAEVAQQCKYVFSIVGYPNDVEQIYFGEQGLIAGSGKNTILVDMTTSTPSLAKRIYEKCKEKNVSFIDAPVSGGDVGAKNGTLSIMCGGDEEVFKSVLPLFSCLGKSFSYMGGPGSGQHTKAANQILVAANLFGVVEAVRYAESVNLDPKKVIEAVANGAAGSWQLINNGKKILDKDYAPGFFSKHFLKDLRIAFDVAEELNLKLPLLELAKNTFDALCNREFSEQGTQVLYEYYATCLR